MVSGFLTSPCDHSRIFSGLASEMRIAEKDSGSFGFSKKEKMSRIRGLLVSDLREKNFSKTCDFPCRPFRGRAPENANRGGVAPQGVLGRELSSRWEKGGGCAPDDESI